MIPSILVHIPFYGASDDMIGIVGLILVTVQTIIIIVSIIPTERALKNTFPEEGGV